MLETLIAHADTIVVALGIVGGWIWHKVRGDSTDSARSMLIAMVRGIVHAEVGDLDDMNVETKLRELVAQRAKSWLTSRKITGAIAEMLAREAVEIAVAELRRLISQHEAVKAALDGQLGKLDTAAQKLLEALNAKPLVPPLEPGLVTLEVVKPVSEP